MIFKYLIYKNSVFYMYKYLKIISILMIDDNIIILVYRCNKYKCSLEFESQKISPIINISRIILSSNNTLQLLHYLV